MLISGPAGIGKSRLLRELIATATKRVDGLAFLRGRCLPTGRGITFWPLGEILRQLCGISLDEAAESAAAKLERRTAGPLAALGLGPDEIRDTIAALATSASLAIANNPLERVDPDEVAEQMSRAWPRLVTGLASMRPLAILIEDIHWADARMLRMVEALATRSQGPVLLLATARPEFIEDNAGFGAGADVPVVALRPLTDGQSERLIDELLGSAQLPRSLVEEIQRKADGNPFFVEEIVQRLIDEGALVERDGGWQATELAATVKLPDTIHALLAARIDSLPADEKRLIQEAAVVGRVFWPGALAAGSVPASAGAGAGAANTDEILRRVERRGLIAVRPTSTIENETEYIFRHVLIRDVAYASVPKRRRARAHADTGQWIEQLVGDRIDELAELVAYHYAAAVTGEDADLAWGDDAGAREDVRRRAFGMLLRAGEAARRRFAVDKAIELHTQALGLATTDHERTAAHEELGDDHEALFHGDEAVREYLVALETVPATVGRRVSEPSAVDPVADTRGRLAGKAGRMVLRWGTFEVRPPLEAVQALVTEALQTRVSDRVRATLLMVDGGLIPGAGGAPIAARRTPARVEMQQEIAQRIRAMEEGMSIAERLDDVDLLYLGGDLLSIAYQTAGDFPNMRRTAEGLSGLLGRLTSARQQADSLVTVASVRNDDGDYEAGLDAAEDGFRRSVGLSAHERMHNASEILGAADPLGRWDRIVELLPWYAAASAGEGDITCSAVRAGPAYGATILARRGLSDDALSYVRPSEQSLDNATFVTAALVADYASIVADVEFARRITARALTMTDAGFLELGVVPLISALERLDMFDELEAFVPIATTKSSMVALVPPTLARAEALVALHRGNRERAERSARDALAGFERLAVPYEIARIQELLARTVGEPERGQLLGSAIATYEVLGAAPFAERARAALATEAYAGRAGEGGSSSSIASAGK